MPYDSIESNLADNSMNDPTPPPTLTHPRRHARDRTSRMLLVAIHALLQEIINLMTDSRRESAECRRMINAIKDLLTKLEAPIEDEGEAIRRSVENKSQRWDQKVDNFEDRVDLEAPMCPIKSEATSWNETLNIFDQFVDAQLEFESPFVPTPDFSLSQFSESPIRNLSIPIEWPCAFRNYIQRVHNAQCNNIPGQKTTRKPADQEWWD